MSIINHILFIKQILALNFNNNNNNNNNYNNNNNNNKIL